MILSNAMRFYRWLYYRCYRYSLKADSSFAIHWVNASVFVFVIFVANLMALGAYGAIVYRILLKGPAILGPISTASSNSTPTAIAALIAVGIIISHIALLKYKGCYKRIIQEFSKESLEQQRRGDRLFGWYLVGSLALLIVGFILLPLTL